LSVTCQLVVGLVGRFVDFLDRSGSDLALFDKISHLFIAWERAIRPCFMLFLAYATVEVLFVILGGQTIFHVAFADTLATGQNDELRVDGSYSTDIE